MNVKEILGKKKKKDCEMKKVLNFKTSFFEHVF